MNEPPVILLGVRRSGTTLLRVMLDRNSRLAVPDESYFVPPLAQRHRGQPDLERFVDDVGRFRVLREWGVTPADVRERLRPGMTTGEAISAIYAAYAEPRGKRRWGDKTPLHMDYLRLFERLFPSAQFVHLIRDGRDAALSVVELPEAVVTRTWPHPRSVRGFACQWRSELLAARALGRRVGAAQYLELRYEALVEDAERELVRVCRFAGLPFEPAMLAYAGEVDVSEKPHQQRLLRPPMPGVRDWRRDMSTEDVAAFEGVAADVLARLGYETRGGTAASAPLHRARHRVVNTAWKAAVSAFQRSPLWAARHPPLA
jgi:hypothetical protein